MTNKLCNILQEFVDSTRNLMIFELDDKNTIVYCNNGFREFLGLKNRPTGRNIADFLLPENYEELWTNMNENKKQIKLLFGSKKSPTQILEGSFYTGAGSGIFISEKAIITHSDYITGMSKMNNELMNLSRELNRKNSELKKAHEKIKILSGKIAVCSSCKKIRNEQTKKWEGIEDYIRDHSEAMFSHSVCPECLKDLYPDFYDDVMKEINDNE